MAANGLGENRSWQFNTTTERAQKAGVRGLIEQQRAGGFRTVYNATNTATTNYEISGDYVDCTLSASTNGNSSQASQSATVGSPNIGVGPAFNAQADGNVGTATSGGSGSTWIAGNGGSAGPALNQDQSNTAPQTATVGSNTVDTTIGSASGSGSGGTSTINGNQSNDNAVLNSTVSSSSACSFAAGAPAGAP